MKMQQTINKEVSKSCSLVEFKSSKKLIYQINKIDGKRRYTYNGDLMKDYAKEFFWNMRVTNENPTNNKHRIN